MFTGIVERLGKVVAACRRAGGLEITIAPLAAPGLPPWRPVVLGESISVSGVCLTVARSGRGGKEVTFQAVPETVSKTTLGGLRAGDRVNLERSLAVGDLVGGHFVTGHIDGTGKIHSVEPQGSQVLYRIGASGPLLSQVIPKGSIAVDGVSLTVIDVERDAGWLSFAAIPHTVSVTTLGLKEAGDPVNLEADMLGKWVVRAVGEMLGERGGLPPSRGRR
jgi:riboflavin synthase